LDWRCHLEALAAARGVASKTFPLNFAMASAALLKTSLAAIAG